MTEISFRQMNLDQKLTGRRTRSNAEKKARSLPL